MNVVHRYVIPAESYFRWKPLGWRVARQQPDVVTGLLIENECRYPLYPCAGGCDQAISELRFTAFSRCVDCYGDDDEVRVVLH